MKCVPVETLSDLLDGALPAATRWRVRRHLARCSQCRNHLLAEKRWCEQLRHDTVAVTAPVSLRISVLTFLAGRWRRPRVSAATASRATACAALLLAAFVLVRGLGRPLPAFAQVERAMRQVESAQWIEHHTTYDAGKHAARRFTIGYAARLNPPALRTDYGNGFVELLDGRRLTGWQSGDRAVYQMPGRRPGFDALSFTRSGLLERPADALRKTIMETLLAPTIGPGGPPQQGWQGRKEMQNGRLLARFDSGIGPGGRGVAEGGRLRRPGYRRTIWADPQTRRVVRTQSEYYDGQQHNVVIGTDFRYDEPLRDNLAP